MKTQIDRKVHKMLKNASRQQMTTYLDSVYQAGYEAGQKDAGGLNSAEVFKLVQTVKGIGEQKALKIVEVLNGEMDAQQEYIFPCGNCGVDLFREKGAKFCPYCGAELTWEEEANEPGIPGQVDLFEE